MPLTLHGSNNQRNSSGLYTLSMWACADYEHYMICEDRRDDGSSSGGLP